MRNITLLVALACVVVLVLWLAHKREVDASSIELRGGLAFVADEPEPFSGRTIERFDDGSVKAVLSYKTGLADGTFRSWHPNGQLWIDGRYVRGSMDGLVRSWGPSGELWFEKEYRAGALVGCRGYWNGNLEPDSFWCRW